MIDDNRSITACRRCGTCCRKGGPSFHIEDKALIEKGLILLKYLYTIREGELAYDNVKECLQPVTSDIIKIKGKKGSLTCVFLEEEQSRCEIYDHRPAECEALQCWDTRHIEEMYSKDRLTRRNLISGIKGPWELVEDHNERCSYLKLARLTKVFEAGKENAVRQQILDMVRYDSQLRTLILEKGGIDRDILDFLLGRPLSDTIRAFGYML